MDAVNEKSINPDVGAAARTASPFNTPLPAAGAGATTAPGVATIFEVPSTAQVLPCEVSVELPIINSKCTTSSLKVYTALQLKQFRQMYLIAEGRAVKRSFTAPAGAIVVLKHVTGTHKHVHHEYYDSFIVKQCPEREYVFKDLKGNENVTGRLKNLDPIDLDGFNETDVEAEVANRYHAKPSNFDPVQLLYWMWVKKQLVKVPVEVSTASELELQVKKLEELIAQKQRELQALQEQLSRLKLKLQLEAMKRQVVE